MDLVCNCINNTIPSNYSGEVELHTDSCLFDVKFKKCFYKLKLVYFLKLNIFFYLYSNKKNNTKKQNKLLFLKPNNF